MKPELEQKILEELKAEMAANPARRSKLAEHDSLIAAMRQSRRGDQRGGNTRILATAPQMSQTASVGHCV